MSEDPLELAAWERSREATRRIMADAGCDEKGHPLPLHPDQPRANRRADTFDGYVNCIWRHCPFASDCAASGDCADPLADD